MKIFNKLEEWIGGTLFVCMFIILVMQITARQILGTPLMWSEELSSLLFVYVGMLGISMGIRNQQHVLIDFLCSRFSPKMQRVAFTIVQIIIFISIIFMGYLGNSLYKKKWIFELVSLKISAGWMYIALPIVAVLMMIRFFQAYKENYDNKKVVLHPGVFLAALIIIIG